MQGIFAGLQYFEGIGIEQWNVGKVKDFSNAFANCRSLNNVEIGIEWNTSSAEDMTAMFTRTEVFDADMSKWDTSRVTSMAYMFYNAGVFFVELDWCLSSDVDTTSMLAGTECYMTLLLQRGSGSEV